DLRSQRHHRRKRGQPQRILEVSEEQLLDHVVAEFPFRIELVGQCPKIVQPRIKRPDRLRSKRKDLGPMRSRAKRCQSRLDYLYPCQSRLPIGLPGEMEADSLLPIGRAEPEIVGRNRADFRDKQSRRKLILYLVD